jgi:hypothetical protein
VPQHEQDTHFVITFRDPRSSEIKTLRARSVSDSQLGLSFVAISDFVFEPDSVIVNPEEEALQSRLENVRSLHLSIYAILSVEEVGTTHSGLEFTHDRSNLVVLPTQGGDAPR